ncbi:MAG: DNA-processing protein DprA, partial [Jiangellaceae bacterium]
MTADERAARAALSATVEPGTVSVARRIRSDGVEATWHAVATGRAGLDPAEATEQRAEQVDGAAILAAAEADRIRFICPGDEEWPGALDSMVDTLDVSTEPVPPPFGLWVRGSADLGVACARAVAVVGSRASTRYGQRVASDLGADLALAGWTVVSGAAFGIDAAAHRGALALGGATLAVMACGVDVAYPRAHAELLDRILAQG